MDKTKINILKTLFGDICSECGGEIKKGELYGVAYIVRKTQRQIDVLEAYRLRTSAVLRKSFCGECINKIK